MMTVLIERLILRGEVLGLKELIFTSGFLDGNQSTSDIHSVWAACIYRTTGRHGYHSANRWSYNYNTSLPSIKSEEKARNQSRNGYPRFPALCSFFMSLLWVLLGSFWMLFFVPIGPCDFFSSGF